MSAGLLGLSGFAPQRQDSQVVASDRDLTTGWSDWLANWERNYAQRSTPIQGGMTAGRQSAIADTILANSGITGFQEMAQQAFGQRAGPDGLPAYVDAVSSIIGADMFNRIDNSSKGRWINSYTPDPAELERLQAEKAAQEAARNNVLVGQQAYAQQRGGEALGGLLDPSYANPFGSTITGSGMTGATSPTAQPASNLGMGTPVGSGTNAAPSTGLNPWQPQAANGAGGTAGAAGFAAWGGPFGRSNPWSLGG